MPETFPLDRALGSLPTQWRAPIAGPSDPARSARRLAARLARHRRLRAAR